LSETDLTNEHILAMVELKGAKTCFPKLKILRLNGNDIRK